MYVHVYGHTQIPMLRVVLDISDNLGGLVPDSCEPFCRVWVSAEGARSRVFFLIPPFPVALVQWYTQPAASSRARKHATKCEVEFPSCSTVNSLLPVPISNATPLLMVRPAPPRAPERAWPGTITTARIVPRSTWQ